MGKRWHLKHFSLLFMALFIGLASLGCNSFTTSTSGTDSSITTENDYSMDSIYVKLISFQARLFFIKTFTTLSNTDSEPLFGGTDFDSLPNGVEYHSRTALLNARDSMVQPSFFNGYLECLEETNTLLEELIALIEDHDDILIGVEYDTFRTEIDYTYLFEVSKEGYVTVKIESQYENAYLKMGFLDGLLDYREMMYAYNLDSNFSSIEDSLYYHYYQFTEDKEFIHSYYSDRSMGFEYTSEEEERLFSVHSDRMLSEEFDPSSYSLSAYDVQKNVNYHLTIDEGEIAAEYYSIYNDNGFLYSYGDSDVFDQEINLYTDFTEATGWDYILSSNFVTSDEIRAASGIFRSDGTRLYSGDVFCEVGTNYVSTQLRRTISPSELSDDELRLANYGIYLEDDRAGLDFLNSVKVSDVDDIKEDFTLDQFNYFVDNQILALFNAIDSDVVTAVLNIAEPIETTGDVLEFNQSVEYFRENLAESNQFSAYTTSSVTTTTTSGASSETSYSGIEFDLNEMYFRSYSRQSNQQGDTTMLLAYADKLVEFISNGYVVEFSTVSDSLNQTAFEDYVNQKVGSRVLNTTYGMISIQREDAFKYHVDLDQSYLGPGIDMTQVFLQGGISGLDEATITATIVFEEDYKGYTMEIDVTGLYLATDPTVRISINDFVSFSSLDFTKTDPMTLANTIQLPDSISEIIFDTPSDYWVEYYSNDTGYSWVRMELEAGYYNFMMWTDFVMYDSSGNTLEVGSYLKIEVSGTYYLKIHSDYPQMVSVNVFRIPDQLEEEYDLVGLTGHLSVDNYDSELNNYIHVPAGNTDRFIRFDFNDGVRCYNAFTLWSSEFLNGATWGKTYDGIAMSIYFFVPAGELLTIHGGGYYIGTIEMDYEIFDVPTGTGTMPVVEAGNIFDIPDIILSPSILETRINFNVSEAGIYRAIHEFYDFGMTDVTSDLYSSNGTLLVSDWDGKNANLAVGDYYIIVRFKGSNINLVAIVPRVIKD